MNNISDFGRGKEIEKERVIVKVDNQFIVKKANASKIR